MVGFNEMIASLLIEFDESLVNAMINSHKKMQEAYILQDYKKAELFGGEFTEACIRMIEQKLFGRFTPINRKLPPMAKLVNDFYSCSRDFNDSYREHIPRVLFAIYGFRNSRGVGHLPSEISPNYVDATLVYYSVNWVLAELFRINYNIPLHEAQSIIDKLMEYKVGLIQEVDGRKRVTDQRLTIRDQVLLLLYNELPDRISEIELFSFVEYKNKSRFINDILKNLHRESLIDYFEGNCLLLPKGKKIVELNLKSKWRDHE